MAGCSFDFHTADSICNLFCGRSMVELEPRFFKLTKKPIKRGLFKCDVYLLAKCRLFLQGPTSNQVVVLRRSTPLAAGESVHCRLQLRMGPAKVSLRDLAGPAVDAFLQKHPPELTWKDHRAIATIFFATSVAGYAHNPRGWLLDPTLDVTPGETALRGSSGADG
jgi:hypothetical protein